MFSAAQGNLKKIKTSYDQNTLWGNVLGSARPSDVCKHRSICGRLTFDHILVLYLANVCEAMSTSSVSCYNTLSVRVYNLSIKRIEDSSPVLSKLTSLQEAQVEESPTFLTSKHEDVLAREPRFIQP